MLHVGFVNLSSSFAPPQQAAPSRNLCTRRPCCYRPPAAALRGHSAKFSGDGSFLSEQAVTIDVPHDERVLVDIATPSRPSSSGDNSLVAFYSGAVSRGPSLLNANGSFALEAVLPVNDVRVAIRVVYGNGKRIGFVVTAVSENGEQPFGQNPALESRDIAGAWLADNYRWTPIIIGSGLRSLPRTYGPVNSLSPSLVRLPLGISVVAAPNYYQGSKFSFGTGWLPELNLRPVMIRSYDESGRVEKIDWRNEIRQ